MSGTLEINAKDAWMPAGWVFDGVLEAIAEELKTYDSSLASSLLDAKTEKRGHLDLTFLNEARFRLFLKAVDRAYMRWKVEGESRFRDPAYFSGFMKQFEELLLMIRKDPRAA